MRIAIVDPGSGNLASVLRALETVAEEAGVTATIRTTTHPQDLNIADRIVLPGQGAFAACRAGLDAIPGMVEALERAVRFDRKPFLGICVGMQLLCDRGLEHGVTAGLGWLPGEMTAMDPHDAEGEALALPQMGWNQLDFTPDTPPLLDGVKPGAHAYFVHSYAWTGADPDDVLATTDYGGPVVAMVGRGNIAGTQFHVEKSGPVGLRILTNFLDWNP
jgi:glutamine amidotransferase